MRHLIRELVAEGRTVLLSSHLLDEVEKTCDLAAIVDRARSSPRARSTSSCAAARGRSTSYNPAEAARLLTAVPGVTRASDHDGGLRDAQPRGAGRSRDRHRVLRRLLDHGVAVERVAPSARSLEDRFLTMTTRLEDRS